MTTDKVKVFLYKDKADADAALVEYISKNTIIDTRWTDFWNDRDVIDFSFFGMPDPEEWYGPIDGVQLTNVDGERIIFASWFPEDTVEEDEYLDRIMEGIFLLSPRK